MEPDLEVVYKAHADSVQGVTRYLRSRKCHPMILDTLSPILEHTSKGHATIRIAVPSDEAKRAREILVEMEVSESGGVEQLDHRIKKDLLRFLGVFVIVVAILYYCLEDFEATIQWGAVLSLVIALLWSNGQRIRDFLAKRG